MKNAEGINSVFKREQKEILSPDILLQGLKMVKEELLLAEEFLIMSLENPKLILTDSKFKLKTNRHFVFESLRGKVVDGIKIGIHDVQSLLANIANEYLQEWLKDKGIVKEIKIEVRNPMTFPSIFAVYFEGKEIIQFNIFEQWYGIRKHLLLSADEIEKSLLENKKGYEENVNSGLKNVEEIVDMIENPRKYANHHYDYYVLFFKRKKLNKALEKKLENAESLLKYYKQQLQLAEESIPVRKLEAIKEIETIESIKPFFMELSYSYQEKNNYLY